MLCRALIAAVAVTCTLSHALAQAPQRLERIKVPINKEDIVADGIKQVARSRWISTGDTRPKPVEAHARDLRPAVELSVYTEQEEVSIRVMKKVEKSLKCSRTDLICVLVLSGMQKEDLDVSLLTKLQQYNVNIDDVNNEELRQACIQSKDNSSNDKVKNIIETQPFISKLKSDILDDYKTKSAFEVLNKRDNLENLSSNMSTYYKMSNKFHENNNKTSKVIAEENKSDVDEITQYPKANLEKLLRYLQDERVNNAMKYQPTTQAVSIKEQESKRSITENLHSPETETLNRLIANLLTNQLNKPTTTKKPLNIEDLYEKLISSRKQDLDKIPNVNSDFQRSFVQLPIQENARKTSIEKRIIESESDTKRKESKIPNDRNIFDALLNTYESFNAFMPDAEMLSNLNGKTKESLKLSVNPYRKFQKTEITTSTVNLVQKKEISQDMIKEIADNVKEMVLRELRKELHETKKSTITTSTIMSTTTHSTVKTESTIQTTVKNPENIKAQESVMNKFLELFEEIKSLKQKTIMIPSKNENRINNKEIIPNVDIKQVHPQIALPVSIPNNIMQHKLHFNTNQVYGIKQYPIVNSENFAPQEHKYRPNGAFKKQELPELNKGLLPITVQTNNIEIPPLNIPLDKSQNLVRQNIIITTTIPHRIIPIKIRNEGTTKTGNQHIGIQQSVASESFKGYKSKQVHPRPFIGPYKLPAHHFHSNIRDDVIRFTLNNNEHSKYNADYYEKINIGKYKRPATDDIKYQETPRFHEKLENVERYLDYPEENKYSDRKDCCNEKFRHLKVMVDCCNRKIASRHQMSINNMKKESYDDTHFKKFLQSQQKVTDMLEKILGDKSSNFQSVETA